MSARDLGSKFRVAAAALCVVWMYVRAAPASAEVASARRPLALFTPGPTVEYGLDGRWRFGGELTLAQYVGRYGYGASFGGITSGRIYLDAQPALVFGKQHNLVLGLNPGLVVDVTDRKPRWGGQATFWFNYVYPRRYRNPLASPIVPFVRAQAVDTFGFTFTFGLMVKFPLPTG